MRVYVVGDVMLDVELFAQPRDNYENALMCLIGEHWDYYPGGAANVAGLLQGLGHEVTLFGLTGSDWAASKLEHLLRGVETRFKALLSVTTTKLRVHGATSQIMCRADCEYPRNEAWAAQTCLSEVQRERPDCVVFSDYGKGVFGKHTEEIVQAIIHSGCPTVVDPKLNNYSYIWRGATVATPNSKEAAMLKLTTDAVVITKGAEGVVVLLSQRSQTDQLSVAVPAPVVKVMQIVGAGDAFTASVAGSLAEGRSVTVAAQNAVEYAAYYVSTPRSSRQGKDE